MANPEIVEVYSAANLPEAHFLHNLLASAEIDAQVVGAALGTGTGLLPAGRETSPRLWVREKDFRRAREIIAEYERIHSRPHSDDEPTATWTCSVCHEAVESDFDLCWNCQTPRQPY